jgi:hypothetical protein
MSEILKGRAHPPPGMNAGAPRAPCFLVVTMISPIAGAVASTTTYNDRQGPIDLTPISEPEAKHAIVATQQTQ